MDINSYLNQMDKDINEFQKLSIEEHTRHQTGKTDFYENIEKMKEQVEKIQYILENISEGKNSLDYGINNKLDFLKISTLKYIVENLLKRVHLMENLQVSK